MSAYYKTEDWGWAPADYPDVQWRPESNYDWPNIEWHVNGDKYSIGLTHDGNLQSSEMVLRMFPKEHGNGYPQLLRSCAPYYVLTARLWLIEFGHPNVRR
jgi:hypothetical protein